MKGIFGILLAVLLFTTGACTHHVSSWSAYQESGKFQAEFPGKPVVTDKVETTPFGKKTVHYVSWKPATLELNKFKLFQVSYTECPTYSEADSSLYKALENSINIRKKDFTDNDIQSQAITINQYPARAFMFDPPHESVITIVKQVIVNNRRFDITVIAKKDYPTNDEIGRFFNSIQLHAN